MAMAEQLERETTVLFAHVLGGADLIAKGGDAPAIGAVAAFVDHLRKTAKACGARVIDSGSERLMVLLSSPDAAADAAAAMHTSMDSFPQYTDVKLALGIGFHHGPVIQKDEQVYGDTVNLAAQLVAKAANGQIITTRETASHFSPIFRALIPKPGSIDIKGRPGQGALCEPPRRPD